MTALSPAISIVQVKQWPDDPEIHFSGDATALLLLCRRISSECLSENEAATIAEAVVYLKHLLHAVTA